MGIAYSSSPHRTGDHDPAAPATIAPATIGQLPGAIGPLPLARERAWIDRLLWVLLALGILPLSAVLSSLPWTTHVPQIILGALLLLGLLGGGLALFAERLGDAAARGRDPDTPLGIAGPLAMLPVLVGVTVAGGLVLPLIAGNWDPGYIVCGALAASLGAYLPVLTFTRSAWLAIGLTAGVVALVWHTAALSPSQHYWLAVLLADWALVVGTAALRTQARGWARLRLAIHGAVWWPALRRSAGYAALIALVGLVPLLSVVVPPLRELWDQSPLHQSPLISSAVNAAPSVLLGQNLRLAGPAASGNSVVLTYALRRVPSGWTGPTALLGATLDTYDAGVWHAGATAVVRDPPLPSPPPDAATVDLEVTLVSVPPSTGPVFLPSLDTPLSYSIPSATALLAPDGGGAASDWGTAQLSVADWQAVGAVGAGVHYKTTAVLPDPVAAGSVPGPLPADPHAFGWSPTVYARLTAIPAPLAPTLTTDAQAWAGTGSTVMDQVEAVADRLHALWMLASTTGEPPGDAAISDLLTTRRGNGLTWVTAYALLCRALGIPTRVALGFTPGVMNRSTGEMTVRTSDFLAWVQIALPGVGWESVYPLHSLTQDIVVQGPVPGDGSAANSSPASTATPTSSGAAHATSAPRSGAGGRAAQHGEGGGGNPLNSLLPPSLRSARGWLLSVVVLLLLVLLLALLLLPLLIWWSHTRAGRRIAGEATYRALAMTLRYVYQCAASAGAPLHPSDTPAKAAHHTQAALPATTSATARTAFAHSLRQLTTAYERLRFRDRREVILTWGALMAATRTLWQALRPWGWTLLARDPLRGTAAWLWLWRHSHGIIVHAAAPSAPVARPASLQDGS